MPKYKVIITEHLTKTYTATINAENEEQAEELVREDAFGPQKFTEVEEDAGVCGGAEFDVKELEA